MGDWKMDKIRRLFGINVKRISLVNRAANNRSFLIVKHDDEELPMEELMEKIKSILKSMDSKLDKIEDLEKTVKALEASMGDDDVLVKSFNSLIADVPAEKAGAKFSSQTLKGLKAAYDNLKSLLLGAGVLDADSVIKGAPDDTKITVTEGAAVMTAAVIKALGPEVKKEPEMEAKIAKVLKELLEKKEKEDPEDK